MITINELNNLKQRTYTNNYYVEILPHILRELIDKYLETHEGDDDTYENYAKQLAN